MPNWEAINKARVKVPTPRVSERYCTTDADGMNGLFRFVIDSKWVRVIASDGGGWKHVSVTIEGETKPPTWELMCKIKNIFWDDTDWVMQFHPASSDYVNNHPGCLHLWQPTNADFPKPDSIMVGIKKLGVLR